VRLMESKTRASSRIGDACKGIHTQFSKENSRCQSLGSHTQSLIRLADHTAFMALPSQFERLLFVKTWSSEPTRVGVKCAHVLACSHLDKLELRCRSLLEGHILAALGAATFFGACDEQEAAQGSSI
jgi:hypothetical protein